MKTDRELMQQALDALENSVDLVREDAYQAEKLYGNYPTRQGKVNGLKVLADDHEKAITALTERLAQPEQEPDPIGDAQDRLIAEMAAQPEKEPVALDQATMELAESVGLIGPASRTHDLHAAIQRFHDLICVNATIKAVKMAADAIREATPPAALAQSAERNKLAAWMQAQGYATGHGDTIEQLLEELRWQVEERGQDAP